MHPGAQPSLPAIQRRAWGAAGATGFDTSARYSPTLPALITREWELQKTGRLGFGRAIAMLSGGRTQEPAGEAHRRRTAPGPRLITRTPPLP